jgi:beta-lactamase regulating signal transducer with metallopeptidase domain
MESDMASSLSGELWPSLIDTILDASAKSLVLLALASVTAVLARKSSAALRHQIWCLSFVSLILLPLLCICVPRWNLTILPAQQFGRSDANRPGATANPEQSVAIGRSAPFDQTHSLSWVDRGPTRRGTVADVQTDAANGPSTENRPADLLRPRIAALWPMGLLAIWITGALVLLIPFLAGSVAAHWRYRRGPVIRDGKWCALLLESRARLGLRRPVRLLETAEAMVPVTWGVLRPVVLLPEDSKDWSLERRRYVLLHELAHIKRLDVLVQFVARIACSLYWVNPLVWFALGRLRIERELACDDCVVAAGEVAVNYADELVEIARAYRSPRLAVGLAMARTSRLEERIVALLDRGRSRGPVTGRVFAVLVLCAAMLVSTAAVLKPVARAAGNVQARETQTAPATIAAANPPAVSPSPKDQNQAVKTAVFFSGRVDGPDNKPVVAAHIWLQKPFSDSWKPFAATDSRGAFRFAVDASKLAAVLKGNKKLSMRVAATANGLGFGWADLREITSRDSQLGPLTIRLVKDVPIEGRILTADGQPAPGVKPQVNDVRQPTKQKIDDYIKAVRKSNAGFHSFQDGAWSGGVPGEPTVVTGPDGRFTIQGLGAERIVLLSLKGQAIHNWWIVVVTRPVPDSEPQHKANGALRLVKAPDDPHYYARFTHVSEAARTLRGVVRDRETGKPLAGVSVNADFNTSVVSTTGSDGRFELVGCRKEGRYKIEATSASSRYFRRELYPQDRPGLGPLEVTVEMVKGITVRGRVTDKQTGQPVVGSVEYYPLFPNPHVKQLGDPATPCSSSPVAKDGSYELQVLPGPGALGVRNYDAHYALSHIDLKRVREVTGWDGRADSGMVNNRDSLFTQQRGMAMGVISSSMFKTLEVIKPDEKATVLDQNLVLVRGRDITGTVFDDKRRPVVGVLAAGLHEYLSPEYAIYDALHTATFRVEAVPLDGTRIVLFCLPEKHLAANVEISGREAWPLTVRLQPSAAVIGRLIDVNGDPVRRASVEMVHFTVEWAGRQNRYKTWTGQTDDNGNFRVDALIPGLAYRAYAKDESLFRLKLKPGETRDLGIVRLGKSD